jgi:tetratricopeptide (TPR) repeat protein
MTKTLAAQPATAPRPAAAGAVDPAAIRALLKDGKLAEAEALCTAGLAATPARPWLLRLAAQVAEQRGDLDTTMARWAALRAADPQEPIGYIGAIRSARKLNRLDLTKPILDAGREKLWDNLDFVTLSAQLATATRVVEDAERGWLRASELEPANPEFALNAATAQIGPRKGRQKRLRVVLERLDAHHTKFPDYVPAYTAHIDALRELRRLPEAEKLAAAWTERFPTDVKLSLAHAGVHEDLGQADETLAVIASLRKRVDPSAEVEAAYIRALCSAGQIPTAEQVCAAARTTWPGERAIWLEYARIASRQADWEEWVRRLEQARAALPNDDNLARELHTARAQITAPEAAGAEAPDGGMWGRFESIGGTDMGCEFGMMQRSHGANTLGLLRWARTRPHEMIAALECEFEGVGDDEHTELDTVRVSADREEYITKDKRFFMESHTFVRTCDAPADRMHTQTCRRLRFLKGKLLEDLRAGGGKVFVYKAETPIDDATILEIHAGLASFGDNALLCVMRGDATHPIGSVRQLGHGVFVGYVTHFLTDPAARGASDVPAWTTVCTEVDARWRAVRGGVG